MKREILFRAQRVDNGKWVEGDLIHGVGYEKGNMFILPIKQNLAYLEGCDPLNGYQVIPESVCQFTGLTDKNGINIFEGDIVEVCGCGIASVIFNTSMASFMVLTKSKYTYGTNIHVGFEETEQDEIEVIGNIFDSPELLK